MHQSYQNLAARVVACYQNLPDPNPRLKQDKRLLIAIAGPPGSSKGKVAVKVAKLVNQNISCSVISVDGWCHNPHRDLDSLVPLSPPWTFNGAAAVDLVEQIRHQTTDSRHITSPFSSYTGETSGHEGLSEANVASDASIVIFEGLYLLCEELPWARIRDIVDERWFVEVAPDLGRQRVIKRFLEAGIEPSLESACQRYDENDIFNAEFVNRTSKERDVTIKSVERRNSSPSN